MILPILPNDEGATEPTSLAHPEVGHRVLDYRIEQELTIELSSAKLFLADDLREGELVLLGIAENKSSIEALLAGPASGTVLRRTKLGRLFLAVIAIDEAHLARFGEFFAVRGERSLVPDPIPPGPTARTRLNAGDIFAKRYMVNGVLGRGGMGEVYSAYDNVLRRRVALKLVRVDILQEPSQRESAKERLLSEARVVCALRHRNIVELFDAGEVDGIPYLILELCQGGNLRSVLRNEDASFSDRLRLLTDVAKGLSFAHANGVIHRDVKPENILLTSDGIAKVADFGIAKALHVGSAETFSIVGTPRYMAPEQLVGGRVDGRADQYAWGLMAQELLYGVHPRDRETLAPVKLGTPGEHGVSALVARAASAHPRDRFPNFDALLKELCRPSSRPPLPRKLALLSIGMTAVVSLACLAKYTVVRARRTEAASAFGATAPTSSTPEARPKNGPRWTPVTIEKAQSADAETVERCAPSVQGALASGLQMWRDASQWEAMPRFEEATQLDPTCAVAHFYYVITATHTLGPRRNHFQEAIDLRSHLRPREIEILQAIRPLMDDPPNYNGAKEGLERLLRDAPDDIDIRLLLARQMMRLGDYHDVQGLLGSEASPQTPGSKFLLGLSSVSAKDEGRAEASYEDCLKSSPNSADCLLWYSWLRLRQGRCADAEVLARRLLLAYPESLEGHAALADAIYGQTASTAAARSALEPRWNAGTGKNNNLDESRTITRAHDEYRLAVADGRFDDAVRHIHQWLKWSEPAAHVRTSGYPVLELLNLLDEMGRQDEAARVAAVYADKSRSWIRDEQYIFDVEFARTRLLTGSFSRSNYQAVLDVAAKTSGDSPIWKDPNYRYMVSRAGLDSEPTLPDLKAGELILNLYDMTPGGFERVGRDLMNAGRPQDALAHFRAGANVCDLDLPVEKFRAKLALGEAAEQLGDHELACENYNRVLQAWGRDSRSKSAKVARMRAIRLGCTVEKGNRK